MYKSLIRKIGQAVVTLFCATLIIFLLTHLVPGDPVRVILSHSGDVATSNTVAYEERKKELQSQLGLDQPLMVQYASWVKRLLSFDLGTSIHTGRPIQEELAERVPATLLLSIPALLIQVVVGVFFGMLTALKPGGLFDRIIRMACVGLASVPAFMVGLLLLSLFAVTLNMYEISPEVSLQRVWLPAFILGIISAPQVIRIVRANMLSQFGQMYVLAALSRGLGKKRVVQHALKNALLPAITIVALSLTTFISGAVVIESIFAWPGIGKYALDSVLLHDYPAIQGYAFVMVAIVISINLLVDLIYVIVDPRIRNKGDVPIEEAA